MQCARCRKTKPEVELTVNSKRVRNDGTVGISMICRPCNTERVRAYRNTKEGKEAVRRAVDRYEGDNPGRRKAWVKARSIDLQPCEECGTEENVHRHHPDISKPMKVEFLCAKHHKRRHLALTNNISI